jgi:cytoskeletal protein RodZ
MSEQLSLSQELRQAREARGESLEQVHQRTGIALTILKGLEEGDFDVVEPVYARLAIDHYATHLGLDGKAFEARLRDEVVASRPPPVEMRAGRKTSPLPTPTPSPLTDLLRQQPPGRLATAAVVVVVLAIVLYLLGSDDSPATGYTPPPSATAVADRSTPPPAPLPRSTYSQSTAGSSTDGVASTQTASGGATRDASPAAEPVGTPPTRRPPETAMSATPTSATAAPAPATAEAPAPQAADAADESPAEAAAPESVTATAEEVEAAAAPAGADEAAPVDVDDSQVSDASEESAAPASPEAADATQTETTAMSDAPEAVVSTAAPETPALETPALETPALETPALETPALETAGAEESLADATPDQTAAESGEPPVLAPTGDLVLQVDALDSTWVQIQWDDDDGVVEIIPEGEQRLFAAQREFLVRAGRAHGVHFRFQGQLLGAGRLGDPTKVLRFRATADGVQLLGPDLEPLGPVAQVQPDTTESPGRDRP